MTEINVGWIDGRGCGFTRNSRSVTDLTIMEASSVSLWWRQLWDRVAFYLLERFPQSWTGADSVAGFGACC